MEVAVHPAAHAAARVEHRVEPSEDLLLVLDDLAGQRLVLWPEGAEPLAQHHERAPRRCPHRLVERALGEGC